MRILCILTCCDMCIVRAFPCLFLVVLPAMCSTWLFPQCFQWLFFGGEGFILFQHQDTIGKLKMWVSNDNMLDNIRHFALPKFLLNGFLTHYEPTNDVLLINRPTSTHQWVSSSAMKTLKMTSCSHLCGELGGGGTMRHLNPVAVNLAPIPKSG